MKTVALTQNKSIQQQMQFGDYEPTDIYWTFEEVPEGTKVSWRMKSDKTAFIFKLFAAIGGGMDKMLGEMEEKGLANIEREILADLEKNPPAKFRLSDVSSIDVPAQKFIGYYQKTTTDAAMKDMTKLFKEFLPKSFGYGVSQKLSPTDMTPGAVYTKWDEETKEAEFYIGVLVKKDVAPGEGMTAVDLPAGKVVMISKFAPYGIGDYEAHTAINKYMATNKLTQKDDGIWELYVNDPSTVKPEDIQTDVYYPVK